jgi:hypothetical protein
VFAYALDGGDKYVQNLVAKCFCSVTLERRNNVAYGMTPCSLVYGYPTLRRNLLGTSVMEMEQADLSDILICIYLATRRLISEDNYRDSLKSQMEDISS